MSFRNWLPVICMAAILGLAACGGDDAPDDTGGKTAAATPTVVAGGTGNGGAETSPTAGTSDDGGSGAAIDACTILLESDVDAMLEPTREQTRDQAGPLNQCLYSSSGRKNYQFVEAQVCACYDDSAFDAEVGDAATDRGVTPQEVSGVGDRAFAVGPILWVKSGEYTVTVEISTRDLDDAGPAALQAAEVALASTLIGRLP